MEEVVVQRLIAAAERAETLPGWSITVRPIGIRIAYTWQGPKRIGPMGIGTMPGQFFTTENITGWGAIEKAYANPLLTAMDDLMQQKQKHMP